jgi:hypothetical protein
MKFFILYQGPATGTATFQTEVDADNEEAALDWFKQWYHLATVVAHRKDQPYTDKEKLKIKLKQFDKVTFKTQNP